MSVDVVGEDMSVSVRRAGRVVTDSGDLPFEVLEFELKRPIRARELPKVLGYFPDIKGRIVLGISGRGPIWLYAALVHKYLHSVLAVATYDPKVGYVVVASHTPELGVGDVIVETVEQGIYEVEEAE